MPESRLTTRDYLLVCGALLALTALTYAAAGFDLGIWNAIIALGIAALKAALIILFFMHARGGIPLVPITIAAALLWLAILLAGTLNDVVTRGWLHVPGR